MESIYLVLVVLLFLLAASDLWVGVSNDAVNFMNSAIGSKAAKFRTIVAIAAVGIFCGAVMSNGMMDIARHGVFQPDLFSFREVMTIFLAVMVTDIVLLDIFNSFGMPTSTTVSMVFELLGASFALAMIKTWGNPGTDFGDYINSGQALGMITAIFISVGIAFVFGTLVMYITRLIFTFKYKVQLKFKIGIFGGLAVTAILYFMLFKGLSNLSFMTPETKEFINTHIAVILGVCFVVLSIIMQILHFLKINVLRIVVLLGTFALAMGSSFADRAWGRESAVFRITGVLTVIGGWFITAAVAFISCFTIANIMHYGGFPAQVILITVAVAMLIHSNISYAKRKKNDKKDVLFYNMLSSTDSKEIVKMLQEHVGKNVAEITDKFSTLLIDSTDGLFNEKLHSLRKSLSSVKKYKVILKSLRRREIICLRRTDVAVAVRLSTPFHLLHNALFQLYYSLLRICRPSLEHVDNNFLPIDPNDAELFRYFRGKVVILMNEMAGNFAELNLGDGEEIQKECSALKHEISDFRDKMMVNIQTQNCDITATTLLLHLLQELEQILHEIDRLIYNMRKFSRLASETPSKQ